MDKGFIFIEVAIAVVLVTTVLLALTGGLLVVFKTAKQAEFQSHMPYYAQEKMEGLKMGLETDSGSDTSVMKGVVVHRIWSKKLYENGNGKNLYKLTVVLEWTNGIRENVLTYDTLYTQ